jgi:DnaJ family protein C protein 7
LFKNILQGDPDMQLAAAAIRNSKKAEDNKEEANGLFKAGKLDEALDKYMETINVDPYNRNFNALVYGNVSSLHLKRNNPDIALKSINKSLEMDKNYAKGYFKRAEIHSTLENWTDAERDFRTANGLDSTMNLQSKIATAQKKVKEYKKNRDFYKTLGVERNATAPEIKKAFRKISLKYHPDKVNEEDDKDAFARKWQEVVEASDVLQDPKKKLQYDQGVYDDGSGGGGGGGGAGFEDLFGGFGGGGGGGGDPMGGAGIFKMFFGDGSMNNFNFGGGGQPGQGGASGFPGGQGGGTRFRRG